MLSFVLANRTDTDVFFIWQLDLGIPAMTTCCNQLDLCYETCGTSKYDCDSKFRLCLHGICSDINKSLGFVSKVQGRFGYFACPFFFAVYYSKIYGMLKNRTTRNTLITLPHFSLYFSLFFSACESMADTLYNTVWTLGCRSYMNGQRAACFCEGEEREELWHRTLCTPECPHKWIRQSWVFLQKTLYMFLGFFGQREDT